jgi:hypothetical protein
MIYSKIPPTCSQWSTPKIISPIWPSQGKNSLYPTCGRSRKDTSTLLNPPKKLEVLTSSVVLLFEFIYLFIYLFIFILSGGCTLALFYISKSVSIFISVQQHSLCSAASCLFCVLVNCCCLDKFVD